MHYLQTRSLLSVVCLSYDQHWTTLMGGVCSSPTTSIGLPSWEGCAPLRPALDYPHGRGVLLEKEVRISGDHPSYKFFPHMNITLWTLIEQEPSLLPNPFGNSSNTLKQPYDHSHTILDLFSAQRWTTTPTSSGLPLRPVVHHNSVQKQTTVLTSRTPRPTARHT